MTSRMSHPGGKLGGMQIQEFDQSTLKKRAQTRQDILKVAIQIPNSTPQLYEINQKASLKENINDFCLRNEYFQKVFLASTPHGNMKVALTLYLSECMKWNISHPESYALQHSDTKQFITEKTRNDVKNGALLTLEITPVTQGVDIELSLPGSLHPTLKVVDKLLRQLTKPETPEEKMSAMKKLSLHSKDPTFSNVFIDKKGLEWLISAVEKGNFQGENLAYALTAILELMDHGLVGLDILFSSTFVKRIASLVNKTSDEDVTILGRSLGILECIIANSQEQYHEIADSIIVGNLISHLQRSNSEIQQNAIALINALFVKSPNTEKGKVAGRRKISDTMAQKQFRTVILNHVIRAPKEIGAEMAHQLHVLQVLTFNLLEERMLKKLDPLSQEDREKLLELRNIAFESTNHSPTNTKRPSQNPAFNSRDFKKLGFVNFNNPVLDFDATPPGILALDVMVYFARNQQDNYIRVVLENSSRDDKHECPFGRGSISLMKMICEILKIGEQPTETAQDFYPMFFTHDHALEEFYCIAIQLFNKTWKEMSAIKTDFDKVMSVVRDQIVSALNAKPASLDSFKQKLTTLSYNEILKKRQQERADKEQFDSRAIPVVELQREIRPTIVDLIKKQRRNFLKEGTAFAKIGGKRIREKSRWFCRLSPNLKFLHYGDIEDSVKSPAMEFLTDKIAIADIKEMVVGKNCPHIKTGRTHKSTTELSFSILHDPDEALNFVAPDKDTWSLWTDGINSLLGKAMSSAKAKYDEDMILTMEMKLRLLDLENIPIPDHPPEIPPLPNNYNFATTAT